MKSYIISVSLYTGCYRHIQISAKATLYNLHQAILDAFEFDDLDFHAFFMDNIMWSFEHTYHANVSDNGNPKTRDMVLERLNLETGHKFRYLFDSQNRSCCQCKLLRETAEDTAAPRVIRSAGAAPNQFPSHEERDGFPDTYQKKTCRELYAAIPVPQETVERIRQYCQAAANFYARLPVRDLMDIYNRQNEPLSQKDFLAVLEVIRHEYHPYYAILGQEALFEAVPNSAPIDREILAQYLWYGHFGDYDELVAAQRGKPLKVLPKEELLKYTDEDYTEVTAQSAATLKFLKGRIRSKINSAEDILYELNMIAKLDDELDYMMDEAQRLGLTLRSAQDAYTFINLLQELSNNTRKYCNRGYTPNELHSLRTGNAPMPVWTLPPKKEEAIRYATVSGTPPRNGPCPCGSGRKYKQCCGKNK